MRIVTDKGANCSKFAWGGPASTFNPYLYVRGNPVNLTDPSGRLPLFLIPVLAAAAGAVLNGGAHAASQLLNGVPAHCLDWSAIGRAAGEGAVLGLASFAIGAGVGALGFSGLSAAVAGEAGEFGFGYAYDRLNGYDHDTALHNNLIGLGIGAGLGLAGWAFSGGLRNADFTASHSHIDEVLDPHSMNADPTAPRLGRSLDDANAPRYRSDGGGCVNSFSAETTVVTADGDAAISTITEGDLVLAYNEMTGEIGEYVVTDTISHVDQTVVLLTIDGETLTTTAEHPFYTTSGEWVDAGDLEIGDEVVSLDGNGTVESIAVVVDPQPMYNLTVDEAHTFFVGDGDWLVHNAQFCPGAGEIGDHWDNRYHGKPDGLKTGLYEYRSGGDGNWYVGMTWGESLGARLNSKKPNFGNDWNNIHYSNIEFPNIRAARIAERVRMEQIMAELGINQVANATPKRIRQVATRQMAIDFMQSGDWTDVPGWPKWLQLPENMVELPKGIK